MRSAGAAEFLDCEPLIPGIKQDRVHRGRYVDSFFDGLRTRDVDHLHHRNSRQRLLQFAMSARRQMIAYLKRIRATQMLLRDDLAHALPRSK